MIPADVGMSGSVWDSIDGTAASIGMPHWRLMRQPALGRPDGHLSCFLGTGWRPVQVLFAVLTKGYRRVMVQILQVDWVHGFSWQFLITLSNLACSICQFCHPKLSLVKVHWFWDGRWWPHVCALPRRDSGPAASLRGHESYEWTRGKDWEKNRTGMECSCIN